MIAELVELDKNVLERKVFFCWKISVTTSLAMKLSTCCIKSLFLAKPGKERISMQLSTERLAMRWLAQTRATLSIFRRQAAR